ncbi:hypothetical protein K466DRAFT_604968 [Polyporus arcularius HHB13444]|uniref:Uncharacterized protein n=1 Tax=Polyporus arcularius HHB13444 TaxID=1314778 RepID=A0A5C3NV18_9APHY|nr:hypothetical protein K466DRAFT_604968 [Polyporus arcularius HHB13444]
MLPKWLATKINDFHQSLLTAGNLPDDDVYLGLKKLSTSLEWHQYGSGHTLVTTDALKNAEQANKDYTDNNDDSTAPPLPPSPANLVIIARIASDGTFAAADGRFGLSSTSRYPKTFEKTQLTFMLERLTEHPKIAAEFDTAVGHLRTLFKAIELSEETEKAGLIVGQDGNATAVGEDVPARLKLRHAVFAKRTEENENDEEGLPTECTIAGWPAESELAQAALKKIQDTHIARPLQAYDERGELIMPSKYNTLRNSICLIRFNVFHYCMPSDEKNKKGPMKDIYVGDVSSISVIYSRPLPSTPSKRVALRDPFSPNKKKINCKVSAAANASAFLSYHLW